MTTKVFKLVSPNENALVTKHNKLVEARYSLTLQEQRLVLWIVSQIEPDDEELSGFEIPIKELGKFLGVRANNSLYAEMKEITEGLVVKILRIEDPARNRFVQTAWLSEAVYQYGQGTVRVNVSNSLREYLIGLKEQFTTYSLRIAVSLKSTYAIRIYELLMQYKTIGHRTIEIEDLRAYLGLNPDQYPKHFMFKKRTILMAQKEINGKSDISFEFEEIKRGRKVTAIKFIIESNPSYGELVKLPMGDDRGVTLVERLKSHGITEQTAWNLVHAHIETDPARITWHIDKLESLVRDEKAPKSPAGWLVKAIDTDHRPQKTLFQKTTEQAKEAAEARRAERQDRERQRERIERRISDQEKDYRLYVGECIDVWHSELSEGDRERIGTEILGGIGKAYAKDDFRRKSWGSMFNQARVIEHMKANDTPLPFTGQDEFFRSKNMPLLSELEDKLKAFG